MGIETRKDIGTLVAAQKRTGRNIENLVNAGTAKFLLVNAGTAKFLLVNGLGRSGNGKH